MGYPLGRRLERLASERWARRGLRTLLRSAWLGLSLLCVGLGLQLLLDWQISLEILGALALLCLAIGAMLLLRRRMPAHEVARRLDHRFDLNEQLATALEVSARGDPQGVEIHLLEQASATTGHVQKYVSRNKRQPWIELATLLTMALLGLGMFLLLNLEAPGGQPTAEPLPDLNDPAAVQNENDNPFQPDPETSDAGGQQPGASQNTQTQTAAGGGFDQQSAEALADALRDQSVTRPAAEALDQGNAQGAAQSLRELADQADQLSDDTRRDLARELRQAAADILPNNPEFAEQVRESAYGMQQSGQSTAEALENLADAVEQLDGSSQQQAQQGQQDQQDQQGQQGQQASGSGGVGNAPPEEQREQAESSERLGVEGVPLELESQGDGGGGSGDDDAQTTASSGGGFVDQTTPPDDTTVRIGDDPLRIPADLRDVVQEYFSPTE